MVLEEIKAYLRQNISQEQMQQSMRKQHEDNITAYKAECADCGRRQEQIKAQNQQNYEKYHEGQMSKQLSFMLPKVIFIGYLPFLWQASLLFCSDRKSVV